MKNNYEVIVGNVGTMTYTNYKLAKECYETYVSLSTGTSTRAAGEPVTLMKDGEIIFEHTPTKFKYWAAEINKDWWHMGYKAIAEECSVTVYYIGKEVARIDYNSDNGRYTVSGMDVDAVEQLEWLLSR